MTMQFNNVAAELAGATVGCRVRFSWLGSSRSLDDNQSERAAEVFGANADALKVQKKLFDDRRPEYRAVNRKKTELRDFWKNNTLPFTEPGVRLLRRDNVERFSNGFGGLCDELAAAVVELDGVYVELLSEARERLGELYNAADYPASLAGKFSAAFDFPNLSPPDYLAQLAPELYERERERVAAAFSQSVELAENAFSDELAGMLGRIVETLNGATDGKPKIFRDSMIENVGEFFERFRALNITGSGQLTELVERAQAALSGVTPGALRASVHVRDIVKSAVADVHRELSAGMVDRPARRLQLSPPVASVEPRAAVVEPVAVVSAEVAAAFGLNASPIVRIVEPEPEQPAEVVTPRGWDIVETSVDVQPVAVGATVTPAAVAEVAEPVAVRTEPEPVAAEPEPARFTFNYGAGRRLTIGG